VAALWCAAVGSWRRRLVAMPMKHALPRCCALPRRRTTSNTSPRAGASGRARTPPRAAQVRARVCACVRCYTQGGARCWPLPCLSAHASCNATPDNHDVSLHARRCFCAADPIRCYG
jgi:hypothetical protein